MGPAFIPALITMFVIAYLLSFVIPKWLIGVTIPFWLLKAVTTSGDDSSVMWAFFIATTLIVAGAGGIIGFCIGLFITARGAK